MKRLLAIILLTYTCSQILYARPKVGLVLSGGGARCAAHIGVIEALEEMHIPIDYIVGTSMGAVIGGLYASGVPIEKINHDFSTLNWENIFTYNIQRKYLYYRRKLDNDIFLLNNFISYSDGQLRLPSGIITGQNLYEVFNSYLLDIQPIHSFERLPIPFKAVSTDLVSGDPVVLEKGDLALSMLASMAVPGIISPVDIDGLLLADGGVSNNLPIEVAKSMGADILIVVDVSTPMSTKEQMRDLTGVLEQITNILTHENIQHSEALLTQRDILLTPDVSSIETQSFEKFSKAVLPGKLAAFRAKDKLESLRVEGYEPYRRNTTKEKKLFFAAVELENDPILCDATYFHYLKFPSTIVAKSTVAERIEYLYGLNIFQRIFYGIEHSNNEHVLSVTPVAKSNRPLYIQGSLFLDTDFQTTNTFGLLLGISNPELNRLLGEWRLIGQLGLGEGIFAEYYQPLTTNLAWFVNPFVSVQRVPIKLYVDFDPMTQYLAHSNKFIMAAGRNFSNSGRIFGYFMYEDSVFKRRMGPALIPEGHMHVGEVGINLEWDTLDNLYFPKSGMKGSIQYSYDSPSFGADDTYSQFSIANIAAISKGRHSLALLGLYERTLKEGAIFPSKYFLGGMFQLTGLAENALLGNNAGLGTAAYFYKFKNIPIIPNRPTQVYLGGSIEAGKVWGQTNLTDNEAIYCGSLFLGVDSLIGPIYFGGGMTTNGRKALHLSLRPPFRIGKLLL